MHKRGSLRNLTMLPHLANDTRIFIFQIPVVCHSFAHLICHLHLTHIDVLLMNYLHSSLGSIGPYFPLLFFTGSPPSSQFLNIEVLLYLHFAGALTKPHLCAIIQVSISSPHVSPSVQTPSSNSIQSLFIDT